MTGSPFSRRHLVWLGGLAAVVLASLLLRSTFTKKDATLSNQAIIEAVQRGDWDAINAVPPEPLRLSEDLEQVMAQLGDEGSQIAATLAGRYPGPQTARFMLTMARSTHQQAAVTAAMALSSLPQAPSVVDIASTAKRAVDPMVRAQLYLALGRSRGAVALPLLRELLSTEVDATAATKGTAAAARLGGKAERVALMARVTGASVANAKDVYDDLLYVGNVRFAKGLLPWLDQQDPVTRIGSDEGGRSARLCDLAVWTAKRLGVPLPVSDSALANYDDATLQATRAALLQLKDP